jgi:serine/threonine-protein kinase
MGEVYRARDTRLGRDVAIKILPKAFARDTERMARFQREARMLASLNHSTIASIYGLENSGNTPALVMELVEGPTLADRIAQGPIPIEEVLALARQTADALEYAHERGIIHRDLKPANVKVAGSDAIKVLDFGLAKALTSDPTAEDINNSPTIDQMATQPGVLLGTAAYMSPEQAKAKSVDRRADIWAFGCVLYEMLTGEDGVSRRLGDGHAGGRTQERAGLVATPRGNATANPHPSTSLPAKGRTPATAGHGRRPHSTRRGALGRCGA